MNELNTIQTVIEKSSGKLIEIKAQRFNPLFHEEVTEGEIVKDESQSDTPSLESMSFSELKKMATKLNIGWTNTVKKAELIELLKNA